MFNLLNIFPIYSMRYSPYCRPTNAKFFTYFTKVIFLISQIFFNFSYVGWVKNCMREFIAASLSMHFAAILHIFKLSSYLKMFRINTIRYIAFMKNEHPFWNFTMLKFIGHSVGVNLCFFTIYPFRRNSIISRKSSFPKPTMVCFSNMLPKAIFYRYFSRFVIAFKAPYFTSKNRFLTSFAFIGKIPWISIFVINFDAFKRSHSLSIQYQGAF